MLTSKQCPDQIASKKCSASPIQFYLLASIKKCLSTIFCGSIFIPVNRQSTKRMHTGITQDLFYWYRSIRRAGYSFGLVMKQNNEATLSLNRLKELLAWDYLGAKVVCATQRVSIWLNFGPPTTFLCHIWLNFGSLAHFCVTAGRLLTVRISLSPMASIFPSFSL